MKRTLYIGNVLVVDDVPHNVQLLARILKAEGHTIRTALSGPEAITLAHNSPPDIILLDIQMPEMDGYAVCEYLKADEILQHIPIIFISALTDTQGIVKALNTGGVDYVTKPFKIQEVVARVNSQMMLVEQRREIERLREQDRQHYHALDEMKNEFIRMATHDLKNPLGIIMGYAHIFESIHVAEEHRVLMRDGLQDMHRAVDKMQRLVGDMLDLAKLGTRANLHFEPTALADAVAAWIQNHELPAREKAHTLVFAPHADDIMVDLDAPSFERVFDNLVSNAIKYTPEGGRIEIILDRDRAHAYLHVSDTGYGIPAEHLDCIFKAFYRVPHDGHRRADGTGLGLSIVKTIVEQHGGAIEVESEPGSGSTFSVILPIL